MAKKHAMWNQKRPVGAIVRLHLDGMEPIMVGDLVESRSGRRYSVIGVRVQSRGKHIGRRHLQCIVVPRDWLPEQPQPTARLHTFEWYRR